MPDEGDEVYYSNTWLVLSNFDAQEALKRLCKPNSWHPKPKSKDLTLQTRLLLLFVQYNIFSWGGHRSEPSYMDMWLVDFIMCGRKVNLAYLIVQHMVNVLSFAYSVLPYNMFLTTIFCHFGIELDGETNIRFNKPSDAIDNSYIAQLGYKYHGNE